MVTNAIQLVIILQLHLAMSSIHQPYKRSPIDLKTESPLSLPKEHPNMLTPSTAMNQRKKKAPFIPVQHQLYIPQHLLVLPAHSNIHHSSIHTDVQHVINGNVRIPVLTQTVHHSSSNITHTSNLVPILVPIHHNYYQQQILHDLSVIPLHHPSNDRSRQSYVVQRSANARKTFEENSYIPLPYYGGFGNGLTYGGHGAGHGFYVSGFR